MNNIFRLLEDVLHKSALNDFRNYAAKFSGVTKWIMCSDYCIGDKTKPNDVITFVLYPYILDLNDWKKLMNTLAQADFKNCRHISQEFADFCHKGFVFSVSFILEKKNIFTRFNDEASLRSLASLYIDMLDKWKINTPDNAGYFDELQKRLRNLVEAMKQKSFNFNMLGRIVMTAFLASYLLFLLLREIGNVEKFSWMSDRDKITDFQNNIYEVLFGIIHYCLCENKLKNNLPRNFCMIMPENQSENMFYDEMNRTADLICGGLSSYNLSSGTVTKDKYVELLENVIADNPFIVMFLVHETSISRLAVHKQNPPA